MKIFGFALTILFFGGSISIVARCFEIGDSSDTAHIEVAAHGITSFVDRRIAKSVLFAAKA